MLNCDGFFFYSRSCAERAGWMRKPAPAWGRGKHRTARGSALGCAQDALALAFGRRHRQHLRGTGTEGCPSYKTEGVHTHTHAHTCMHTNTYIHTHIHTHMQTHAHHARTLTRMYMHSHRHMHTHVVIFHLDKMGRDLGSPLLYRRLSQSGHL